MRAWQITAPGLDHLTLVERPEPVAGPGQVIVEVNAMSLNYRDFMIALGTYRIDAHYPIIPLSDGAGDVVSVGEGVQSFRPGDRVVASFFSGWIDGPQTAEKAATALGGGTVDGMLAERVVLPAVGLLKTPEHLSDAEAATLPCAAVTAWNALYEGPDPLRPGQVVLLEGTGGVSVFGLQLAKLGGARAVITSSSDDKLARARALGADHTINYVADAEWQESVRRVVPGGVDHVLEVGGKGTIGRALACLRYGGQLHLIGGVSGPATDIPLGPMATAAARVRRIYVGPVATFAAMNRALTAHRMRPVVDQTFRFDEAPRAIEHLKGASHFGKIVVVRESA